MLLDLCQGQFFCRNIDAFLPDVESNPAEEAHVHVCHPNQRKPGDEVSPPIWEQKLVPGDHQENGSDIVAETVFASEQIEKLALENASARFCRE